MPKAPAPNLSKLTSGLPALIGGEPGAGALSLPPGARSPLKLPPRGKPAAPLTGPRASFTMDKFATAEYPIRPSSLGLLVHCPLRRVLEMFLVSEDEGGPAAQTGSLTHAAVAAYHNAKGQQPERVEAAMAALAEFRDVFPLAAPDDARIFTQHYTADPRNQHARVVAIERRVKAVVKAHPKDPTGLDIVIEGTLDQLRAEKGSRVRLYDLKTGQPSGAAMMGDHAFQCAAYVVAARQSGFPTAEPGCIIRAAGYRTREAEKELPSPRGVFFEMPFTVRTLMMVLDAVRLRVAEIRAGEVFAGPGPHCSYCHTGGLDNCLPMGEKYLGLTVIDHPGV